MCAGTALSAFDCSDATCGLFNAGLESHMWCFCGSSKKSFAQSPSASFNKEFLYQSRPWTGAGAPCGSSRRTGCKSTVRCLSVSFLIFSSGA